MKFLKGCEELSNGLEGVHPLIIRNGDCITLPDRKGLCK
jgi:hypothetical protein